MLDLPIASREKKFKINNTSWIEISKSALQNNLDYIRSIIGDTQLSTVIKGNAYGHGIELMIPLLEQCGVTRFCVFSVWEAYRAFQVKSRESELMIMGEIDDEEALQWAVAHNLEFYVFDFERLKLAINAAVEIGKKAKIHIEFETGMNRTGFEESSLKKLGVMLRDHTDHVDVYGFCTHYAGAESIANHPRVRKQITTFNRMTERMNVLGIKPKMLHTACSAAAINFKETLMDSVRIGILTYGFWPSKEAFILHIARKSKRPEDPLKRIISWKSHVMSTKKVKVGEFIGYGTSYLADRDMRLAAIPVGYAYGFTRNLSNIGSVLIRGKMVPVVGKVNMNMMLVDVTSIKKVNKYDEVVIIGDQGKASNTVASFSEITNDLNYELLTRLPADIPRIIVD